MNDKKKFVFYILIVLAMIVWGGSWTSAKSLAGSNSPEILAFWRFAVTSVSLIPLMIFTKQPFNLNLRSSAFILGSSILMTLYNHLFFKGLHSGLAGAGGVLVTTISPVFTFVLTIIIFKNSYTKREVIGVVLGVFAGLILLDVWVLDSDKILKSGNLIFAIAAFVWALFTIVSQKSKDELSTFTYSFYLYLLSSVFDLFFVYDKGVFDFSAFDSFFWWNILYLSVISTTFATTFYVYGSKIIGSHKASSFMTLVPLSAVATSFIFLDEIPKYSTLFGGIVGITAVYLINFKPRKAGSAR